MPKYQETICELRCETDPENNCGQSYIFQAFDVEVKLPLLHPQYEDALEYVNKKAFNYISQCSGGLDVQSFFAQGFKWSNIYNKIPEDYLKEQNIVIKQLYDAVVITYNNYNNEGINKEIVRYVKQKSPYTVLHYDEEYCAWQKLSKDVKQKNVAGKAKRKISRPKLKKSLHAYKNTVYELQCETSAEDSHEQYYTLKAFNIEVVEPTIKHPQYEDVFKYVHTKVFDYVSQYADELDVQNFFEQGFKWSNVYDKIPNEYLETQNIVITPLYGAVIVAYDKYDDGSLNKEILHYIDQRSPYIILCYDKEKCIWQRSRDVHYESAFEKTKKIVKASLEIIKLPLKGIMNLIVFILRSLPIIICIVLIVGLLVGITLDLLGITHLVSR